MFSANSLNLFSSISNVFLVYCFFIDLSHLCFFYFIYFFCFVTLSPPCLPLLPRFQQSPNCLWSLIKTERSKKEGDGEIRVQELVCYRVDKAPANLLRLLCFALWLWDEAPLNPGRTSSTLIPACKQPLQLSFWKKKGRYLHTCQV